MNFTAVGSQRPQDTSTAALQHLNAVGISTVLWTSQRSTAAINRRLSDPQLAYGPSTAALQHLNAAGISTAEGQIFV